MNNKKRKRIENDIENNNNNNNNNDSGSGSDSDSGSDYDSDNNIRNKKLKIDDEMKINDSFDFNFSPLSHQSSFSLDESFAEDEIPSYDPPNWDDLVDGEPGTMTGRPMRLYADGIFDLFHAGHARALEQAKKLFPNVYLLVGCCNDETTHKLKGKTVLKDTERYESLRHCKWVDELVCDAPWIVTNDFIEKYNIDYVCHDALPYADTSGTASTGDCYYDLKRKGKFLATQRTKGISTSDIIMRIISNYDDFIERQMKRGYSLREMQVPFVKEQQIKFNMTKDKIKDEIVDVKDKLKDEIVEVKDDIVDAFKGVSDKTKLFQRQFLNLFRREGKLRKKWRKKRGELKKKMTHLAQNSLC